MKSAKIRLIIFVIVAAICAELCPVCSTDLTEKGMKQEFWDGLLFAHTPTFKMISRQVRNFQLGHTGILTLVYRSSIPFKVRWFRFDKGLNLVNSEVPNKISTDGDPNYTTLMMTSGDVSATKLFVRIEPRPSKPFDFETVFTSLDGTVQYQITSQIRIKSHGGVQTDAIEGPDWLVTPPKIVRVQEGQNLTSYCAVMISKENGRYTDELTLERAAQSTATNQLPGQSNLKFDFTNLVGIHKDTPNIAEDHGDSLLVGRRFKPWFPDNTNEVIYQVGLTTPYASNAFSGRYLCSFERINDRFYHLSEIDVQSNAASPVAGGGAGRYQQSRRPQHSKVTGVGSKHQYGKITDRKNTEHYQKLSKPSSPPSFLKVELISCRSDNYANGVLIMYTEIPTCLRCRALSGGEGGEVKLGMYRYGVELERFIAERQHASRNHTVKRYVSMSEKGRGDDYLRSNMIRYGKNVPKKSNQRNDLALIANKNSDGDNDDDDDNPSSKNRSHSLFYRAERLSRSGPGPASYLGVSRFIHVADGGVHEVTFTFHRPSPSTLAPGSGYSCRAENQFERKSIEFAIEFAGGHTSM